MLLGSKKSEVDRLLGKPVMAPNLLGLNLAGEKAFRYGLGDFDILVGFFGDMARYMAVLRDGGPRVALSPSELSSALALNAPATLWTIEQADPPPPAKPVKGKKPPVKLIPKGATTYLSFAERDPKIKEAVTREIFGFAPGDAPYAFFYLPVLQGQPPVLPSEWTVNQKLR